MIWATTPESSDHTNQEHCHSGFKCLSNLLASSINKRTIGLALCDFKRQLWVASGKFSRDVF